MKFFTVCWIFYLLFVSPESSAQTKIQIVDKSSNLELPLATIVNLTTAAIRFADENGNFVFEWHNADSIRITHIGYYDTVIQFQKITNNIIQLRQKPVVLPNVMVRFCLKRISYAYNNFNPPPGYPEFGGLSWQDNIDGAKAAIIIRSPHKDAQLSQLEFELKKTFIAPKKKDFPKSPIRFSFYSIDSTTGLPLEPLTMQTVIYYPEKIGKQILKLDSLALTIPDLGLSIAIEYLVESKYCYPIKFDPSVYADSVVMQYPLMFDGVRSKGFQLTFYDYRTGEWYFSGHKKQPDWEKPRATIKFGVIYTYCDADKTNHNTKSLKEK